MFMSQPKNVYRIFNTFPKVYIAFRGRKDSTATLHMALEVAKSENRIPPDVLFVDLEG